MVLQKIGMGGMGVVYAAYDPELDRKIALKLLLPGSGGETGRLRLLREAQALARLSHPNVVTIHDVGTMGEQVWLAMEFLQGQTLGQWLKTPRGWREVLKVLLEAGAGLAAAHAVGLLHRDFKPDNVMIGDDGRVCVMDFGLAREWAGVASRDSEASLQSPEHDSILASDVTRAGVLVGTPSYMAPEQFDGQELTAAADQFAFCVTLWQGLYGERPFDGETLHEIITSVLEGKLRSPTHARAAPSWLRRVCTRGLLVDPAQRWPSMSVLLEALAKGRTRAGVRRGLAALGVLALLGGGIEVQRRWDLVERNAACEATGAEVEVAWNSTRKQTLREALEATGSSNASTTAHKVMPWLDQRAQAWREARVEACLDTNVRGLWDAQTQDRSLWCLEERRMELQSLVDELGSADAEVLHKAVTAAAGLASVTPCRDQRALLRLARPPPREAREAVRAVRADVVRASNLERTGRHAEGLALARDALARAEALEWPPLVAAARMRLGSLLDMSGTYAEAELELERAYFEAAKGVAPEVMFDAAVQLVEVVGVKSARHAEGRHWARLTEVALEDVPDGEHLRHAELLHNLAVVNRATSDYHEAKVLHERALAIKREALGPEHPDVAQSLSSLANTLYDLGDYDEAEALHEQALAVLERVLGPEHLQIASSLNNLAAVHFATGRYEEAKALYRRALAIKEAALGPEHRDVARGLGNLATLHQATGDDEEAKVLHRRAIAIREHALGPEHPEVAQSLDNLATVYAATGDYEEAKVLHRRAIAIREQALGPEHPKLATSLHNLAAVHFDDGDHDEAAVLFERALAINEKALGPEHPELAHALVGLAELALARDRPSEAVPLARRAWTLRENAAVAAGLLAKARFVLAKALWETPAEAGRDQTRAHVLATEASDAYRITGQAEDLANVERWIAAHVPTQSVTP